MAFDFHSLKSMWKANEPLGKWNGVPVYACPKNMLYSASPSYYYVVFDDNNALVRNEKRYGTVSASGNVTELSTPQSYAFPEPRRSEPKETVEVRVEEVNVPAKTIPMTDAGAEDFFIRIEAEIDSLLKSDFVFEGLDLGE